MGDVAMAVPVLRAFTQHYPEIKITVLTKPFFKPLFDNLQNVEVVEAEVNGRHKGVMGLYKLSKTLKSLGIAAVADLHNVLRSKILKFFFFGITVVQINKGRSEKNALISGKNFKQLKSTHQRYADVFEKLGFPIDLSNPKFPTKVELTPKLKAFISNSESKTIGIAPFAAYKGKMYPLNLMEEVITELSKDYNVILFGGGNKEVELLNTIEAKYDKVCSAAGKLSLKEELALISNLDVMLSMDSGNGHLAAMLGIKVITVWGVTHPYSGFTPFNQPEDHQLLADRNQFPKIPTSVYGNKQPEGYNKAIITISPVEILSKTNEILQKKASL